MKLAIGADHRGFRLKEILKKHLAGLGHSVIDFGCEGEDSVDYPDYAEAVARAVASHRAKLGILICSSGVGMCIAANKVRGIRAALCVNELMATRSRQHNNANVLCLGADLLGPALAKRIVDAWLGAEFEGGRHLRRVKKIGRIEERFGGRA